MHSKSLLIAALAAAAAASPIASGQGQPNPTSAAYPVSTTTTVGAGSWQGQGSYSTSAYTPTGTGSAPPPAGNPAAAPNPSADPAFIAKLLTEPNAVTRFKDIQAALNDGSINLKFDFNPAANPQVTPGAGGQVDLASRANFPILTGTGISSATIFFNPCGLNTPHIHPRATEFLTVATDSNILSGFVLENGLSTEFNTTLTQYQGTVFPQGSIHFQQNLDCKPAVAIAGLNSEDPGASSIAQNFIVNLDPEIVDATLGFPKQIDANNFAAFRKNIPASLAKGVEECLVRCNIAY